MVWRGPRAMAMEDLPEPRADQGQVVVEVERAGICGSELGAYLGTNELRRPPLVMGHEFAGKVVARGAGVQAPEVGVRVAVNPLSSCGRCRACRSGERQLCPDRRIVGVHGQGAFAQYVTVDATACVTVSDATAGAIAEPLACALRAVHRAHVQVGDRVLVFGAGAIGLMTVWVLRQSGVRACVVVEPNARRRAAARQWGATHVVADPDTNAILAELAGIGGEVDQAIDAVGTDTTRHTAAGLLRSGGMLVLLGLHDPSLALDGNALVRSEVTITGSFCYTDDEFATAVRLAGTGSMPDPALWLDVRPLDQGGPAFAEQADGSAPFAKILLDPGI